MEEWKVDRPVLPTLKGETPDGARLYVYKPRPKLHTAISNTRSSPGGEA